MISSTATGPTPLSAVPQSEFGISAPKMGNAASPKPSKPRLWAAALRSKI